MSRYRGPKIRIIRRLKSLPGLTSKITSRQNPPGKENSYDLNKSNKKEYRLRLEEKQKLKYNYGLTEKQLFRYMKEARRRKGITGLILFQLLEMRLDAICFSLGFAKSITQARQFVNHGHITVNEKVVTLPSFQCRVNDIISIKEKVNSKNLIKSILDETSKDFENKISEHLTFDKVTLKGKICELPNRTDVILELNDLLVIEYYSRR